MNEFMFCAGNAKLSKTEQARFRRIARKHGVTFIYITNNTPNWTASRYWFTKENLGEMHDRPVAQAVRRDIDEGAEARPRRVRRYLGPSRPER